MRDGPGHQYTHAWHLARSTNRRLRRHRDRPRRRDAEQRDELAPPQDEHAAFLPAIRWSMTQPTRAGVRPVQHAQPITPRPQVLGRLRGTILIILNRSESS